MEHKKKENMNVTSQVYSGLIILVLIPILGCTKARLVLVTADLFQ